MNEKTSSKYPHFLLTCAMINLQWFELPMSKTNLSYQSSYWHVVNKVSSNTGLGGVNSIAVHKQTQHPLFKSTSQAPKLSDPKSQMTRPRGYKILSFSTQMRMKFSLQINMKMQTILVVGIFIFICRENFMLRCVPQERISNC